MFAYFDIIYNLRMCKFNAKADFPLSIALHMDSYTEHNVMLLKDKREATSFLLGPNNSAFLNITLSSNLAIGNNIDLEHLTLN